MTGIVADVIVPIASAVAGGAVGSIITYFFTRRQQKADRSPYLLFEFADLPEHENLGAVGFRNISSKLELLISGTIRNAGSALATEIKLDIYHFRSSSKPPVHEIARIHVADAIPEGEAMAWNRSIRLIDLTVQGPDYQPGTGPTYKSGTTGIFSDDTNGLYYHYHVVFSCKNTLGEAFSTVYCMEKVVENRGVKGNRMVLIRQLGKYDPVAQFPPAWRAEIAVKESALKDFMATQGGRSSLRMPGL